MTIPSRVAALSYQADMAPDIILLLLLFVISGSSLKYVYVNKSSYWEDAKEYCREEYTNLAPVSNEYDMGLLRQAAEEHSNRRDDIWFGVTEGWKWKWSGGAEATTFFWDNNEPGRVERFGLLFNYKWHDADLLHGTTDFLCYKVHAVREKMTWDEALEFCRENHEDLASVASETEMMLMRKELQKHGNTTEHVWVGLRFLAGGWFWTDRQPLDFEAWGPNEQTQCPAVRHCGALRVSGIYEDMDENMVHVGDIQEWNVRNCTEKLHFLCY